jgi:hypothetical protein
MQSLEKSRQENRNKDIRVEASRGCPPLTHDTAKIDRRKKGKYQPTPQPAPAAEPIRKYQLTEIPQQQEPNNVFANPPPTPDSRPCSPPKKIENTKGRKTNTPAPSRPVEKSFYMSIFFFFDETRWTREPLDCLS